MRDTIKRLLDTTKKQEQTIKEQALHINKLKQQIEDLKDQSAKELGAMSRLSLGPGERSVGNTLARTHEGSRDMQETRKDQSCETGI